MELRHMRYFLAVAEELHFGRAAKRLNVAQPPLSLQIRHLEEELGTRLFQRTSRRVALTNEGLLFREQCRSILAQVQGARDIVAASGRGEAGVLRLGFVTSSFYSKLPTALRAFHRAHPRVQILCYEMLPAAQVEALRRHEIDAGFVRGIQEGDMEVTTLLEESLVLALPDDHPLASREKLPLSSLRGLPLILFPREQARVFRNVVDLVFQKAGFDPKVTQEPCELQTVLALVASGLGASLLPESTQNLQRPGVVYRSLSDCRASLPLQVITRKGTPLPTSLATFLSLAKITLGAGPEKSALRNRQI